MQLALPLFCTNLCCHKQIVDQLATTKEEYDKHNILREAIKEKENDFSHSKHQSLDMDDLKSSYQQLAMEFKQPLEKIASLEQEVVQLKAERANEQCHRHVVS